MTWNGLPRLADRHVANGRSAHVVLSCNTSVGVPGVDLAHYLGNIRRSQLGLSVRVTLNHRAIPNLIQRVLVRRLPTEVSGVQARPVIAGAVSGLHSFVDRRSVTMEANHPRWSMSCTEQREHRVAEDRGVRPGDTLVGIVVSVTQQPLHCWSVINSRPASCYRMTVMGEALTLKLTKPDAVDRQASRVFHIGTSRGCRSRPGALQRRRASSCRCHHGSAQTTGGN